jgi:hypothetical protein
MKIFLDIKLEIEKGIGHTHRGTRAIFGIQKDSKKTNVNVSPLKLLSKNKAIGDGPCGGPSLPVASIFHLPLSRPGPESLSISLFFTGTGQLFKLSATRSGHSDRRGAGRGGRAAWARPGLLTAFLAIL